MFTTINFAISRNSYFLEILKYLSFAALTASAKAVRMKIHVLRLIEIRDNYTIKIERTYTRQSSQSHVSFVQSPLTRSGWATVKREKKKLSSKVRRCCENFICKSNIEPPRLCSESDSCRVPACGSVRFQECTLSIQDNRTGMRGSSASSVPHHVGRGTRGGGPSRVWNFSLFLFLSGSADNESSTRPMRCVASRRVADLECVMHDTR